MISVATEKTGQDGNIRILPPLAHSIAAAPTVDLTFVVGERGLPMTKASFGNRFRDACVRAKMPGRAHGLRKAGARRAAEAGATEADVNAWLGWAEGSRESATEVRGADRKTLASALPTAGTAVPDPHPVTRRRADAIILRRIRHLEV